jgi:tubulin-specific chaperone A
MPPPSQLSIATSSVRRLVKEEASYHKELEKQQARLKNLEENPDGDENAEFQLRQEVFLIFLSRLLVPLYLNPSRSSFV